MTHGELKKNANTSDAGAQRRAEKQRQTKGRYRREAQRDREMQHKRGDENEGRNERQVQSGFPPTKSTPGVDFSGEVRKS